MKIMPKPIAKVYRPFYNQRENDLDGELRMPNASRKSPVLEIARLAGVSKAAAYAALSPGASGNIGVGEETRKRILQAAAQVGYVRNELASSLASGRTNTIGICVQSLRNSFFGGFSSVLDSFAYPAGYSVMIASSEYDSDREQRNVKSFIAKRVDALVVAHVDFDRFKRLVLPLADGSVKVLSLGEGSISGIPCVSFDESAAARLQASHLWNSGRRKVAHLNAALSSDLSACLHLDRSARFRGAWRALSGASSLDFQVSSSYYPDPGAVEAIAAKAKAGELDAVACSVDTLAMGLISSLSSFGVKVPGDLAVIGIDDLDSSSGFFVPLTTVRLPTGKLAEEVWRLLTGLLDGRPMDGIISVQPELAVRKSA